MHASDFEGLWRGDNGAEVNLLQSGDAISGTYTAQATDPRLAQHRQILVGTADGAVIGFITSCPAPHRIMSWIGHLVGADDARAEELHASCQTVDRMSREADMAASPALNTVVFTKVRGSSKNMYAGVV